MSIQKRVNPRWSMDFLSDQLSNGRRYRTLNIIDDYSREMLGQLICVSITGAQMGRFHDQLAEWRRPSKTITHDNGKNSISTLVKENRSGTKGYPTRKTDVERFCREVKRQVPQRAPQPKLLQGFE